MTPNNVFGFFLFGVSDLEVLFKVRKKVFEYRHKEKKSDEYIGEIKNYLTFKGDEGYDLNEINQLNAENEEQEEIN